MPKKYLVILAGFSVAKLMLHFAANNRYGLHADELYYITLSKHLQWGYLDNSPLIAFITRFSAFLFGESTFAYRIIPTVFSALTVFLTGITTFYLGGKRLAISITCAAMICSPAYLATSYFMQPVVFEHFFWTALTLLLIRFIQTRNAGFLYTCSFVLGLGILNKYTILIYAVALFTSYFFLSKKQLFPTVKQGLVAALLCFMLILPNLIWQAQYEFPIIRYLSIVKQHIAFKGTGDYLFQFLFFHGAGMAIWLAGLGYLFLHTKHKPFRFIAYTFLLSSAFFVLMQGKIYYGLGAFPVLFAAGGVCWEKMLDKAAAFWRYNLFAMLILPVIIALPIVIPVLPFPVTLRYFKLMTTYTNITQPLRWEDGKTHQISQFYADMFGWEELSRKTRKAVSMLNQTQRKNTVILTESYAIAAALSYYGDGHIPKVISPTNSFILWSPKVLTAENVIYISRKEPAEISNLAEKISFAGIITQEYAHEKGTKIYLLYKPSAQLKEEYTRHRNHFLQP